MRHNYFYYTIVLLFAAVYPTEAADRGKSITIEKQPANSEVCLGGTATFEVEASTAESFQWLVDKGIGFEYLTEGEHYTGVYSNKLQIKNITEDFKTFSYKCILSNEDDDAYSDPAVLVIDCGDPAMIAILPDWDKPKEESNEAPAHYYTFKDSVFVFISNDAIADRLSVDQMDELAEFIELENKNGIRENKDIINKVSLVETSAGTEVRVVKNSKALDEMTSCAEWLSSPVGNIPVNSGFLQVRDCAGCSKVHGGTDYNAPRNTIVVATAKGVVVKSYVSGSYGNCIILSHGKSKDGKGTLYTLYAHGTKRLVKKNDKVDAGDIIMYSGKGGNSTGYHTHYEVIVTHYNPNQHQFFKNLNCRHYPNDLGALLVK